MLKIILLLVMIFLHIKDDFQDQGIMIQLKQEKYWKESITNKMDWDLYKYDYKVVLWLHSFRWSFITSVPILLYIIYIYLDNINIINFPFIIYLLFLVVNTLVHYYIDDLKANKRKINLITDQLVHITQVLITWYVLILK